VEAMGGLDGVVNAAGILAERAYPDNGLGVFLWLAHPVHRHFRRRGVVRVRTVCSVIDVAIWPGLTQFTRILSRAYSVAAVLVSPTTPCLAARGFAQNAENHGEGKGASGHAGTVATDCDTAFPGCGGETDGRAGRAGRAGAPVSALDPAVLTHRSAVRPFREGWFAVGSDIPNGY
jgi:hypothetical protein